MDPVILQKRIHTALEKISLPVSLWGIFRLFITRAYRASASAKWLEANGDIFAELSILISQVESLKDKHRAYIKIFDSTLYQALRSLDSNKLDLQQLAKAYTSMTKIEASIYSQMSIKVQQLFLPAISILKGARARAFLSVLAGSRDPSAWQLALKHPDRSAEILLEIASRLDIPKATLSEIVNDPVASSTVLAKAIQYIEASDLNAVLANDRVDHTVLLKAVQRRDLDLATQKKILIHPYMDSEILYIFVSTISLKLLDLLMADKRVNQRHLLALASRKNLPEQAQRKILDHPCCDEKVLEVITPSLNLDVIIDLVHNIETTSQILEIIAARKNLPPVILEGIIYHPNRSDTAFEAALNKLPPKSIRIVKPYPDYKDTCPAPKDSYFDYSDSYDDYVDESKPSWAYWPT